MAALAGREIEGGIDGGSLVDLAPMIRDGKLAWDAPAGKWKVMKFTWKVGPRTSEGLTIDGASQDCVDWYIQTVYQPHYDRFKDEFGKTILGFFYDEPEVHGDWGTEVFKIFAERKIDWKKPLAAWKFTLAGDEQAAAVTVNGHAIGGVIGQPTRVSVGQYLKPGENVIKILPIAPKAARLVFFDKVMPKKQ